jgi:hypothetical protein
MDDCCERKYGITRHWPATAPLPTHPPYLRAAVYVILGISTQRLLVGFAPSGRADIPVTSILGMTGELPRSTEDIR